MEGEQAWERRGRGGGQCTVKWGEGGEVLVKGDSGRGKMDVEEWALMFFNAQDLAELRATCKLKKKEQRS